MSTGSLTLTEGLVSASIPNGAHIDVACTNGLAGIEFAVGSVRVDIGPSASDSYRANPIAMFAMDPGTLLQLATQILDALDTPAFTEPEWQRIASVLKSVHGGDEINELAARIESAYEASA